MVRKRFVAPDIGVAAAPQLNPTTVNWYRAQAFEPKYKKDTMSEMYPWLFGPEGLYSEMECPYPCRVVNGVCDCD